MECPSLKAGLRRSLLQALFIMVAAWFSLAQALAAEQATTWQRWEESLTSSRTYENPFLDVTLSVTFRGPGEETLTTLGFWDGGNTFRIRCAFPTPGVWTWRTNCSDPNNAGLHNRSGTVEVAPYQGDNPLYRHGFLRVGDDRRSLVHADGAPFLWIGDTHWAATTCLSEGGFRKWVDDRAGKHFTVLQTNIARPQRGPADAEGNLPWVDRRWNVEFMRKLDREFDYANDHGLVLFVNGLIDLKWRREIEDYPRLVEMIAARYFAHFISYSSSMDDDFSAEQDEIAELLDAVTDRHLITQHTGTSLRAPGEYYDRAYLDYLMIQSGHHGSNYQRASQAAIEWPLHYYDRRPHKPIVNGEAWYDGMATPEQAVQMGYLSLLSGCCGFTYGAAGQEADEELDGLLQRRGSTYIRYLHDFFMAIDGGRPLRPQHQLIQDPPSDYPARQVAAVTGDGTACVAFLPQGGEVRLDLSAIAGPLSGQWFNATTAEYGRRFETSGGRIETFTSPFGSAMSLLVMRVRTDREREENAGWKRQTAAARSSGKRGWCKATGIPFIAVARMQAAGGECRGLTDGRCPDGSSSC